MLPFVVAGIAAGAIYGLAACGLVLTYKTSGIFNFGHGALATAAAYVFYWLYVDQELDWTIAAFIAVLVVGPLLGLMMELIARKLSPQRMAWKVVGTTGLILVVQGLGTIKYGTDARRVDQYLPSGNETFRLLDVNIRYSQVIVTVIAIICVAALYALFRFTRLGIAMRAVVDDPDLVDLQGTDPVRVRRTSWIIGSTLAALSGVLIVPFLGLESITLTFLVVQTFGAAAIGLFSSIPLTFLGGILVGIGESMLTKIEVDEPLLVGASRSLPLLVLIVVMLVTPKHKLAPPTSAVVRPPLQWHGPPAVRITAYVIVFAFLLSVPTWAPNFKLTPYWTGALTTTILMLSLGLLVRTAGIVSLMTASFAAIGAVAFSQLHVGSDLPWILAALIAGLFAVPVGALVAIPAIRLSGLFLALATLGFGLLIERLLYRRSFMFTIAAEGRRMPRPGFADSDAQYYYFVLAFVALAVLAIGAIHRGRLGRILQGMGESPTAVSTLGLNVNVTRVIVFCIGAYIAAIAGVLHGGMLTVAGAESSYYSSFQSIILVAILALAPFRVPWYAIFAGVTQVIPAYIEGDDVTHVMNVIFGFFAVLISCQGGPHGMPPKLQHFFESKFGRAKESHVGERADQGAVELRRPVPEVTGGGIAGLSVEQVTVRFGGLIAVDNLTLQAPMNRITGLMGPNGAGKTTIFNSCSGLNRPTKGTVRLHGVDVSRQSPNARARHGLGRTFQIMELCESLTVADNVALGRESSQAGAKVISQVVAPPSDVRVRDFATQEALELCGISDLADLQAGALSTGQRRLVELARCLAGPFDILLLDEPSSGLDKEETHKFSQLLKDIVRVRGCGVLLVEHDVNLIMDVCSYIYVLDFGRLIFEGTPSEVASSADVQAAYLGSETEHLAELEAELHADEAELQPEEVGK
jgi:ABC-type branched-subunit amino acid transport system ATPase component/branched-subunit amino acid ABC-type transport system permease component